MAGSDHPARHRIHFSPERKGRRGNQRLALGTFLFTKLTRNVDEMEEIRKGNVAPAIVLAAVMVVLALMTAPGLEMALEGLIPMPQLGRDMVAGPA